MGELELASVALSFISDFVSSYKTGEYLKTLVYGSHFADVGEGLEIIQKVIEKDCTVLNRDHAIDKALSCLNKVTSQDRDFTRAGAFFGKAFCYAYKGEFDIAVQNLSDLENIEVGGFQIKKDTIQGFKDSGKVLQQVIQEILDERIRMLEDLKKKEERKRLYKIIGISILAILFVGVALFFLI